jgi:hypothetical protein
VDYFVAKILIILTLQTKYIHSSHWSVLLSVYCFNIFKNHHQTFDPYVTEVCQAQYCPQKVRPHK